MFFLWIYWIFVDLTLLSQNIFTRIDNTFRIKIHSPNTCMFPYLKPLPTFPTRMASLQWITSIPLQYFGIWPHQLFQHTKNDVVISWNDVVKLSAPRIFWIRQIREDKIASQTWKSRKKIHTICTLYIVHTAPFGGPTQNTISGPFRWSVFLFFIFDRCWRN